MKKIKSNSTKPKKKAKKSKALASLHTTISKTIKPPTAKIIISGLRKEPLPIHLQPMLATLVENAPSEKGWLYEIKWDGYRAMAHCYKQTVHLLSRNNKSFNDKYYPIHAALKALNLQAVLDGEIVVLKDSGVTSFGALQNWRSEADGELFYYAFDVLWLNGYNLMPLPLEQRRKYLKRLLPSDGLIKISENFKTSPKDFLNTAKNMGLEGMMAKKSDSPYQPGIRTHDWLKIKVQKRHEVVIGGYTKNENSPKLFSALLVGVYDKGKLEFLGKIGTGFNEKNQREMMAKFKTLIVKKSPFTFEPNVNEPSRFRPNPPHAEAFWLSPKLVCEVSYTELTSDGVMRHPSFEGLREDKNAKDVHMERAEKIVKASSKKSPIHLSPVKIGDPKTLLNPTEETQVKTIKGHQLKFTHLGKIFWPEEGYSKRDLLNYYYTVASFILPYLKNRPQSLNRFPNGIYGESFYQKDVTRAAPEWIKQYPYHTSDGKDKNFIVVQDEADLLWMANLGAIEMNPWNSTIEKPDNPDWCIIDIDPTEKNTFDDVVEAALAVRQILRTLKIEGYCKTSGAAGLHIYIPMGAKYTYDQCQLFARMIATQVHYLLPELTSIERLNINREGKMYIDFLQNRPKATLAAPYSVRPKPGATVSMPLHWEEVKKGLRPSQFTLKNALHRIKNEGDLFKPVLGRGINLDKILKALEKLQ